MKIKFTLLSWIIIILFFLFFISLPIISMARINEKTYIPEKAKIYIPILRKQQEKYWGNHPMPYALAGLGEQESCLSLLHSRCWDPSSRLKTSREEGAGIFQLTRAYNQNGNIRFDALEEIKNEHSSLKDLRWSNIYTRPDLQLEAVVLKSHDDFESLFSIKDPIERLYFTDAAYNGGRGGVQKDRRLCYLTKGCDAQIWFGNVELSCSKSKRPIYGNRNACDINREHVTNVFKIRSEKYRPFFK